MSSLTPELIKEKLVDWTPSTKVQELLGLSSMDEVLFKKELYALETSGVIERDGAKRGLKFRAVLSTNAPKESKTIENASEQEAGIKKKPKIITSSKDTSEIPCEISILPKHEYISEVTNVTLTKLISFLLKGSLDSSRSLSIKRTNKGLITIKMYNDIYLLSDVTYTKDAFNSLLKSSNISLE